ncbi:hypothetical protein CLV59_106122 [Chitinophaga dinghuensis]|uniref:SdrD B-like protein n=1 Tax=Chitinophaga dinghuensis TaxID=1539050 RepID=A0A327VUB0_9BACT|nr:hypothetical protein [Chitinophaga dinghuensis]RAJ79062.1 hypothetical protein CLV59_106122 [Chitinophaga dinghuensis]
MKSQLIRLLLIGLFVICNLSCVKLFAQSGESLMVQHTDSLAANKEAQFLYNNFKITNKQNSETEFNISLQVPDNWKLLAPGPKEQQRKIGPNATMTIPIIVMKQQHSPAKWLPVLVTIRESSGVQHVYKYYIKADPVSIFRVTPITEIVQLRGTEREVSITTRVKNYGTIDGVYNTEFKDNAIDLNHIVKFKLAPGMDTVFTYKFKLNENQWNRLKTEKIGVTVEEASGESFMNIVTIEKVQSELKSNPSPYQTFPLYWEAGYVNWGNQQSFYTGISGSAAWGDQSLSFYYRTKQYGMGNNLEKNVFGIDYNIPKWNFYAGNMSESKYFYLYGTGGRVTYKFTPDAFISAAVSIHRDIPFFTSDNVTVSAQYPIKKIKILQAVSLNHDTLYNYNSFIFNNEATIFNKDDLKLLFNGAIGKDFSIVSIPGAPADELGYAAGYLFSLSRKKLSLFSQMQYNSDSYPGLYKGLRIQSHTITYKVGKSGLGAFYQYNRSPINTLRDTVYNSDILNYDISKYGVTYSYGLKGGSAAISVGRLEQTAAFVNTLPEYSLLELLYTQKFDRTAGIYFNSINGYNSSYGTNKKSIFLTNTLLTANYKWFGIKGYYMQTPMFDQTTDKNFVSYQQTILAGPNFTFTLFKRIKANLFYNWSKTLYDSTIYNIIGGYVTYSNPNNGLDIQVTASIPLESTQSAAPSGINQNYVSVTARKMFNVPIFFHRKYFTLNLLPFNDVNGNGIMDPGEHTIQNLEVSINDIPFISDASGKISYKNVEPGPYKVEFRAFNTIKGLIPASGNTQVIPVTKDITITLPFKKSSVISGSLKILTDSLAGTRVRLENIKVTATDSAGVSYSTLTDLKGTYFINVPAGKYTVSLNPDAFIDKIRPKVMAYPVDLSHATEGTANFEIVDKSREIKFFKPKQN